VAEHQGSLAEALDRITCVNALTPADRVQVAGLYYALRIANR